MKKILIQVSSPIFANNAIFRDRDTNNMQVSFRELKKRFEDFGYELTTADDIPVKESDGIIFIDAVTMGNKPSFGIRLKRQLKKLLGQEIYPLYPTRELYKEGLEASMRSKMLFIIWEGKSTYQQNFLESTWNKFDRILTWDDDLVDHSKFLKLILPIPPRDKRPDSVPFSEKKLLVNMSINKYSSYKHELYSARRKTINYFDSHYPNDFDLYGLRWERAVTRPQRLFSFFVKKHKTYRGMAEDKLGTFSHYKFCLCYENNGDANGYVTEKIFDALNAGTVPIYLGAPNIEEYVDADTFIDRRQFKNDEELAKFLVGMKEEEYNKYIEAGLRFIKSQKYDKFLPRYFADSVIKALNLRLG